MTSPTWVFFGTSLSAENSGVFWRRCGGSWVGLLRDHVRSSMPYGPIILNRSRWGADSRWALKNIQKRVFDSKPNRVFLEFAINDAETRRRISLDEARSNHREMICQIRDRNARCKVVLVTTHFPRGKYSRDRPELQSYYDMYRQFAMLFNCELLDLTAAWGGEAPCISHMPDGIHTNPLGAKEKILPAVLVELEKWSCPFD